MANKQEIFEILTVLSSAYPRFTLNKETVTAYTMMLEDLDASILRAAAKECATNKNFFPSVHELRAAVVNIKRIAADLPTAYEAWEELIKAGNGERKRVIEENGNYYIESITYRFTHPIVRNVAAMLGWPRSFPGDNPVADRAHFFKAYETELRNYLDQEIRLPEVTEFIESQKLQKLEAGDGSN